MRRWLAPWLVVAALKYPALSLVLHGGLQFAPWYWALEALVAGLVLGLLARRLAAGGPVRRRRVAVMSLGLGLLAATSCLVEVRRHALDEGSGGLRAAAFWMAEHLPADARVGAWNAGTLGVLSRRTVINLDGLVNSPDFAAQGDDLCAYFERQGITHLADAFVGGQPATPVPPGAAIEPCRHRFEVLWSRRYDGYETQVIRLR